MSETKSQEKIDQFISIRKFADVSGKSRQAIYQQIHTSLKPYVQEVKGQKCIDVQALKDLYDMNLDSALQSMTDNNCKPCKAEKTLKTSESDAKYIKFLEDQIDRLNSQLQVKDSQVDSLNKTIEQLNNNINQLTIVLSQQQSLHMAELKRLEVKQEEPEQQVPADEQPQQKKKFRLFGKK